MSEQKHGEAELFTGKATDATDSSEDAVSTTSDTESKKTTKGTEESKQDLEPAELKRQQVKEGALRKIKLGEKKLEDYADQEWLQKELVKDLDAEQKASSVLEEAKAREIAREIAKEEMAKERELAEFEAKKAQLNSVGTTKSQRAIISTEFDRLKSKLGNKEALDIAIQLAGIDLDDMSRARQAMRVPTLGDKVVESDDSQEVMNLHKMSQKQIRELAQKKSRTYRGR